MSILFMADAASTCVDCPGSSFTAIGAAFGTMGYFTHADLLYYIRASFFGHWATLLYVLGAAGGLISMAMGQPPRNYLWYFLGPSIYNFLVFTTVGVTGVEWSVAGIPQDQRQVWKLAEPGLINSIVTIRDDIQITKNAEPTGGNGTSRTDGRGGGRGVIEVAYPMVFVDQVLSSQVQWLIRWTGVYNFEGEGSAQSNVRGAELAPPAASANPNRGDNWYLMSNLKWTLVENMTAGTLRSPDLRDVFVTMLSSECGDYLKKLVSAGQFIQAQRAKGTPPPPTVFRGNYTEEYDDYGEISGIRTTSDDAHQRIMKQLNTILIPTPHTLRKLYDDREDAGFATFDNYYKNKQTAENNEYETIACINLLDDVIQGFRWEAGHSYWQLLQAVPSAVDRNNALTALYYGWDIRKQANEDIVDKSQLHAFTKNMILVHLFKNEMAIAPQLVDQRYAPSLQSVNHLETYIRTVGSKNKFGELYTWAVMMPYIQGILVYIVAAVYPIAAMLLVVPGWHKSMFTWLAFFAWAKLWDFGFALTQALEKSLWAMIGNNSNIAVVSQEIIAMDRFGSVGVSCEGSTDLSQGCAVPMICNVASGEFLCRGPGEHQTIANALEIFDRSLAIAGSLDLDLANSYYIYIMAALYFAVPAATGQFVLGAKAGTAQMFTGAIQGLTQGASNAVSGAYQGETTTRLQTNQGSVGQAAQAKRLRNTGLGQQALETGNQGLRAGSEGSYQNARGAGAAKRSEWQALQERGFNAAAGPMDFLAGQILFGRSPIRALGSLAHRKLGNALAGMEDLATLPLTAEAATQLMDRGMGGFLPPAQRAALTSQLGGGADTARAGQQRAAIQNLLQDPAFLRDGTMPAGFNWGLFNESADPGGASLAPGGTSSGSGAPGATSGLPGLGGAPAGFGGPAGMGGAGGPVGSWGGLGRALWQGGSVPGTEMSRTQAYGMLMGYGLKMQQYGFGAQSVMASWGANRVGADTNIAGFAANAQQQGLSSAGHRLGGQVQYEADLAGWDAKNQFASQLAGTASVGGLFAGALNPGQKPAGMEGMAMSGMLGQDAYQAARYPFGDYRREVSGRRGQLEANYGSWLGGFSPPHHNPEQLFMGLAPSGISSFARAGGEMASQTFGMVTPGQVPSRDYQMAVDRSSRNRDVRTDLPPRR